jgi:Holliday junction resolvasome RuvABC endonuclease subunit
MRDLPEGNRITVTDFKENGLRWSRFVPKLSYWTSKHSRISDTFLEAVDPIAIGIDAGIANNGFAVIGIDNYGQVVCNTENKGISLGEDASYHARTKRLAILVNRANKLWKKSGECAQVWIEDHAYGQGGNMAHEKTELHGAMRINMYTLGATFRPVTIQTRLKSVHCNGSNSIDKSDISQIWKDKYRWSKDLTEHELDALLIGLTPIREVIFNNKQKNEVSLQTLRTEVPL